ncbi:hypothetical protein L210DRAFT_3527688 [Boletus edulis BED1]|uniref:GDS1 winged helix domain-containing protein n=1 Tax=Boletus edulis BED1 TaxID=1328754 RepID=A0AAD4C4S1_BOLED|nr:hypothetical protein L210DRAFT_3527688 [Boletus edulis BED1]
MQQQPSPHHPTSSQHNYGTRIRKNSVLKPSARLRQCPPSPHPAPRRIKPVPIPTLHHLVPPTPDPCFPVFPLPGVMLHPEDASNKVFHAIGRSFLSVENRAMTIKDLAEMTLNYGLMCQNVSAASQAITTYIRNHMARCDVQQDHPLLLRHVLSGTPADDDLVPALYSRTGGAGNPAKSNSKDLGSDDKNIPQAPQGVQEERLTNFRRGTMVWYLSKAAGVSCPFARAGIRLCEYGKEGRKLAEKHGDGLQSGLKKQTNHDEAQCGEKRKRVKRGCRRLSDGSRESSSAGRDSQSPAIDSGYGELSADSSDDERPPKVKLTLRLRPSLTCAPTPAVTSCPREVIDLSSDVNGSSSEDDGAGADDSDDADMCPDPPEVPWSLPPYPRRSISVPCYTPTCDERVHSPLFSTQQHPVTDERRRSPSVPWSASPPPDSDHDDFDLDFDSDVDWDSSSLSVPSPAPALRVKVEATDDVRPFKHEPADIRDMLDAWEDLDCAPTSTVSSATVKLPPTDDLKFDALEFWEWEFESGWTGAPKDQQDLPIVKMEPDEHDGLTSFRAFVPGFPVSPSSPLTYSSHHSSSPISESGVGSFAFHSPLSPCTLPISPSSSSVPTGIERGGCALTWQDAELLGPDSVHPHEFEDGWASGVRIHADYSLLPQTASDEATPSLSDESKEDTLDIANMVVKEIGTCHSDSRSQSLSVVAPDVVVVRTCRPCTPDICATQIEGISVYRTMLGSTLLLRRIDTDFVNLSTILAHLSLPLPSPLPSACVNVSHPSLSINGIWVPLGVARLYARGLLEGIESIFLSDDLVKRFPTALQDFYQKSTSGRLLNQFGPQFNTSLSSPGAGNPLHIPQLDHGKSVKEEVWDASTEAGLVEEPLLAIPPSVNLALAALHSSTSTEVATASPEMPLSPTEQEIFRALCVHPDWETEETEALCSVEKGDAASKQSPARERPLRRSRRVADAVAARSRVAPPRTKGPRHS